MCKPDLARLRASGKTPRRALTFTANPCLLQRFSRSRDRDSSMHSYRTHTCGVLNKSHVGQPARLSGWVHRKRDHGNLLFVDLRDHYGITQCVIDTSSPIFKAVEGTRV